MNAHSNVATHTKARRAGVRRATSKSHAASAATVNDSANDSLAIVRSHRVTCGAAPTRSTPTTAAACNHGRDTTLATTYASAHQHTMPIAHCATTRAPSEASTS